MAHDDDTTSAGELLATAPANIAAVPLVLGFVALGGVVLAGRTVADLVNFALTPRPRNENDSAPPEPPALG